MRSYVTQFTNIPIAGQRRYETLVKARQVSVSRNMQHKRLLPYSKLASYAKFLHKRVVVEEERKTKSKETQTGSKRESRDKSLNLLISRKTDVNAFLFLGLLSLFDFLYDFFTINAAYYYDQIRALHLSKMTSTAYRSVLLLHDNAKRVQKLVTIHTLLIYISLGASQRNTCRSAFFERSTG